MPLNFGKVPRGSLRAFAVGSGEGEDGDDEDSLDVTEIDADMEPKEVRSMLRKHLLPIIVSIFFELLICCIYTSWSWRAEEDERMSERADLTWMWRDVRHLRVALWLVFATCLIMRLISVTLWVFNFGPDSVWAALVMFFCSAPFVCYTLIFFAMQEQLQVRTISHNVMSSYELVLRSDNISALVNTCNEAFNASYCDRAVSVGSVSCCVRDIVSLEMAGGGVVPLFGMPETLDVSTWYNMLIKWIGILTMSWVWKDMPLLPSTAADTSFLNDVWIDILDATVFADYILHPWIQYNLHNLFYTIYPGAVHASGHETTVDNGRTCESALAAGEACSDLLQQAIFYVWLVAFFSSIVSPTLWTALRFCDKDSEDDNDIEGLLGDFTGHVRLLNQDMAKGMVDSLIQAQVRAYEESDGRREDQKHPVKIAEGDCSLMFDHEQLEHRTGTAWFDPENHGFYLVAFHDDPAGEPKSIPISRLEPDTEDHRKMCGANCCTGWLKPSHLEAADNVMQRYERRGNYCDALRSLFLLELPFFVYRLHFIVFSGRSFIGGGMILLLKNAIFGVLDLLHLAACGNTKATCLNFTPIDKFEKFIKGSKLNAIFVGPGGMFKLAADITTKTLQEQAAAVRIRLNQHKAWLILEREKAERDKEDPDNADEKIDGYLREIQDFTDAIARVDKRLGALNDRMRFVHM